MSAGAARPRLILSSTLYTPSFGADRVRWQYRLPRRLVPQLCPCDLVLGWIAHLGVRLVLVAAAPAAVEVSEGALCKLLAGGLPVL